MYNLMENRKSRILMEDQARRDKYTKYFLTEDHGGIAAVYPEPVHFEEDGVWKEIDNTLEAEAGGSGEYHNRQSEVRVEFAKYANAGKLVTVKKKDEIISWKFLPSVMGRRKPKEFQIADKETEEIVIQSVVQTRGASLETRQAEAALDTDNWNRRRMKVSDQRSAGRYEDIVEGVDLEYILQGEQLKENIVLKTKEALQTPLAFEFYHPGMQAEQEDGAIRFYRDKEGTTFGLAPLCMYDGAGAYSGSVSYEIDTKGETSRIAICPDLNWLMSEERVLPVTIDPSTETSRSSKDIQDTFVKEKAPNSSVVSTYGSFYVGNNDSYGKCRAFLKFNQLPKLPEGAVIYDARLSVWQYKFSSYTKKGFYITAHNVKNSWTAGAATWNNQPAYDNIVLDYAFIDEVVSGNNVSITPKEFNITKLVRDWYNTGINNGIMLKMADEAFRAEGVFVTSDYPSKNSYGITSEQFPAGVFYYRDTNGLEDYYSYHEQDAGRAGNGYVNDFNGNLVWTHEDVSVEDQQMPFILNHVYNLNTRDSDRSFGKGWRLSIMQELKASGIADFPYVYIDGDGTSHYFYKDTEDGNKLKDEDGLGLVLTQTSSGSYDDYMRMEDKDGTKYVFGGDSFLRQVIDMSGNKWSCQYGPNAQGNYLGYISGPAGEMIQFSYTPDLRRLSTIVDDAGRTTSFHYDNAALDLTGIHYPDGKKVYFEYEGSRLTKIKALDGYELTYQYLLDFNVYRVSQITEYGGSVKGQAIKISYKNGNTTFFEEAGLDGAVEHIEDNRKFTFHFDNYGSPTDILDADGYASSYQYFKEGMKKHKLSKTGAMQKCVRNYMKNPGFDTTADFADNWYAYRASEQVSYSALRDTTTGYLGNTSIHITKRTQPKDGGVMQPVDLLAGTFTCSVYVKTSNITLLENAGANICIKCTQGSLYGDFYLTGTSDERIDGGWEQLKVTFTLAAPETVRVYAGIFETTGDAWFDCFQMEAGDRANKFNIINNGWFQRGSSTNLEDWMMRNTDGSDGRAVDAQRGGCARINGLISAEKHICQREYVQGKSGDVYSFGCWAKADAIPGKRWQMGAAILYKTGDPKWVMFDGNPYISDWQYVGGMISTEDETGQNREYTAIHIYMYYSNQMNCVQFTDIQLVKDDGDSFVYDAKGNLTSAKSAAESESFTYNGSNLLSKMCNLGGTSFEYGYDGKKLLKDAKNSEGTHYYFTYDSRGSVTGSRIINDCMDTAVLSERCYFLRNKTSGKYMDVSGGEDKNGANIRQYEFNGSVAQKWKVTEVGGGSYKLESQVGTKTRVMDIADALDANGTNVQLHINNNSDAQKFELRYAGNNLYQILPKCSKGKRAIDVKENSVESGANVQLWENTENNGAQLWYFEPVEIIETPVTPATDQVYALRIRRSGQYLDVNGNNQQAGSMLMQNHYNGGKNQQFRLRDAKDGWFCMEPVQAPGMALCICTKNAQGYDQVSMQAFQEGADNQKFKFIRKGNEYGIQAKNGYWMDVAHLSYTPGAEIIAVAGSMDTIPDNRRFILETCSDFIESSMTYTLDGRNVAAVTDARGYVTTNAYDAKNRLLSSVTDAKGNIISYAYDSSNDQLLQVSAVKDGETIANTYTYDSGDRLKTIGHNGFTYEYEYDGFGNQKSVAVQKQVLEENTYLPGNGPLSQVRYGNGDVMKNHYDKLERVIEQQWNMNPAYRYQYDDFGTMLSHEDLLNDVVYQYRYDLIGRLTTLRSSLGQSMGISYDKKNRVASMVQKVADSSVKVGYIYGEAGKLQSPGLLYGLEVDGQKRLSYTYDALARISGRTLQPDAVKTCETTYSYLTGAGIGTTTALLESITSGNHKLSYTYDELGNISTISEDETMKVSYTYDELGQLIREDNLWEDKTICYNYDTGGNITARKEYAYTTGTLGTVQKHAGYTYENTVWKDQLTAYNGEKITYDGLGNPLTYRGLEMRWQKGRELKQIVKAGSTITYAYDDEGVRIGKQVDGEATRYYLNGSSIVTLTKGTDILHFVYDEAGTLFSMKVNGEDYYYQHNLQKDVIGLLDSSGTQMVSYSYDSWGRQIGMTDRTAAKIGSKNPFRYRGYCLDDETGLYYLNSRYYDPETGRFISADDADAVGNNVKSFYCKNLYSYCDNNPVVRVDHGGEVWDTVFDVISIVESTAEVISNPTKASAWLSLGADVVCVVIPGLTGGGKIVRAVSKADDVLDGAKQVKKLAKSAKKASGTYHIAFKNGRHYIGKGGFARAVVSATVRSKQAKSAVKSIKWKRAANAQQALIREYKWMSAYGGPRTYESSTKLLNRIWSPGRSIYKSKFGKYLSIERILKK